MYGRLASKRVSAALSDTPVVVIQGPRQCGKSTLAQRYVTEERPYVTLDDGLALDAATRNPDGFLAQFPTGAVLDEVQRAPKIFRSIKRVVDIDRKPGKFLLTGSANVLLLPKISDSLAGRMDVVPLWPLACSELTDEPSDFLKWAFSDEPAPKGLSPIGPATILDGGFPEPLARTDESRKAAWFDAYIKALLERDVRDIADIEGLTTLPRVLRVIANHAGETMNISRLARETGVPHTTLTRYLSLLESVFLLHPIPAWTATSERTIKSSTIHFADSGVLAHTLGIGDSPDPYDPRLLRVLQGFVAMELVRMNDARMRPGRVMHFRSVRRWTVPIVLEAPDGRVVGISMTTDPDVGPDHFKGLEFFADVAGDRFHRGLVLHVGKETRPAGEKMFGVPVSLLWSAKSL